MNIGNKKTILLVEDEVFIAMSEEKALKNYGYNVLVSNTGEEALNEFRNNGDIDLVLMDIDLGHGIDGPETATRMLNERIIPVVFLSSHIEPEIVEKTEKITSYGYVVKNSGITVLDASIKMAFKLFEAHRQITENENKQKAMISNISDVIGIIGADGIMKYKSPNIEKLFGWKPEDLVGTNGFETVHPDDLERIKKVFFTLLEHNDMPHTVEYRYKCKDGSYTPVELTALNCMNNPAINGILLNYKDITERTRSEEIAARSKRLLEAVILQAPFAVHVLEGDFNHINVVIENDESIRLMGEKVGGKGTINADKKDTFACKFFTPDGAKEILLSDMPGPRAFHGEHVTNEEFLFIHPGGTEIFVEASASPIYNSANYIIAAVVTFHDITERKKAEQIIKIQNEELLSAMEELEAANEELITTNEELLNSQNDLLSQEHELRRSEQKYRTLFENMVHGVFYQLADGTLVDINPAGLEMFGLTRDQFMGRTSYHPEWRVVDEKYNLIPPEQHPSMVALRTAKEVNVIAGVFNPLENNYRWLSVNAKPQFKNGDKKPYEVFVTMNDITEQMQGDKALRESELKYRSLIENSSDVVFCVNENGEYQFANKTFASTFGKSPDYFIGKSFWDIYPKEHADYRQAASKKVFETGETQSVEVTVPLPDRTLYYIAKANPIKDETGKVFLNLTTATDITDRRLAEDKIKSLLSEKELILKEVHHRIKNNMNTLISLLSLQAGRTNEPAVVMALEEAGNRIKSMLVLYDKLYQSASFHDLPVNEYIPVLIDQIVRNFPNSGSVKIESSIDNFSLSPKILSTVGMILNELITNTMKYAFMEKETGSISVTAKCTGNRVTLTIQDNGPGIPESVDFENSTGFGLMLVKILTQQLDGSIHLDRTKGTGITLEFDVQQQ